MTSRTIHHVTRVSILAGAAVTAIVLLLPMTILSLLDDPDPELRVFASRDRMAVLIVDRGTRILVANIDDREVAHSLGGRLARPWEPRPQLLIAPADDGAAIGLLESIRNIAPETVMVAGVPGSDPLWKAIEDECRSRGIELRYVTEHVSLSTSRLVIKIAAPEPETTGARMVMLAREETRVVLALDKLPPMEPAHVLIGHYAAETPVDLVITGNDISRPSAVHEVLVGSREIVTLTMAPSSIQVYGGALRVPAASVER